MATAAVISYARPTPVLTQRPVQFVLVICLLATIHLTLCWCLMRATTEDQWFKLPVNCIAWVPGTAVIDAGAHAGRFEILFQAAGLALMMAGSTLTALGTLISARRFSHRDHPGVLPLVCVLCWLGWLPVPEPLSFMYHFQIWATSVR